MGYGKAPFCTDRKGAVWGTIINVRENINNVALNRRMTAITDQGPL